MRKLTLIIPLFVLSLVLIACNGVDMEDPYTRAENALEEAVAEVPTEVDTDTIDLPLTHEEFAIMWESDNPDVISDDGTVTRPTDEAVTVTLTASTDVIEYDDVVSRSVEVTVLPE